MSLNLDCPTCGESEGYCNHEDLGPASLQCKCGSRLFIEARRTGGWWKSLLDGDGNIVDTDLDSVTTGPRPQTVKCAECWRRHPNPLAGET